MKIAVVGSLFAGALLLTGCPSKDSSSSSGATSPSVTASASTTPSSGTGPLAGLESKTPVAEAWTASEGGAALAMLYWPDVNVRVSASCKQADGSLSCDALKQLRTNPPIEVAAGGGRHGVSMGTKGCLKGGFSLVRGKNAAGSEDGFCKFADGSLVSTGALEQYGMKIGASAGDGG